MNPLALVSALAFLAVAASAHAHGDIMRIGSSAPGGGQLRIEPGFEFDQEVYLTELTSIGGQTLYQDIIPSFAWILTANESGLFPLTEDIRVTLALNAVTAGASVRVGGRVLDSPQQSATLGSFSADPEAHIHPEWRLILPEGTTGSYSLSFSLRTTAPGYTESPSYTLTLTNVEPITTPTVTQSPAATASATATSTVAGVTCAGDCDGDGRVTVDEIVRAVVLALGDNNVEPCTAADSSGDGVITVEEIVGAINSALEGCARPSDRSDRVVDNTSQPGICVPSAGSG